MDAETKYVPGGRGVTDPGGMKFVAPFQTNRLMTLSPDAMLSLETTLTHKGLPPGGTTGSPAALRMVSTIWQLVAKTMVADRESELIAVTRIVSAFPSRKILVEKVMARAIGGTASFGTVGSCTHPASPAAKPAASVVVSAPTRTRLTIDDLLPLCVSMLP